MTEEKDVARGRGDEEVTALEALFKSKEEWLAAFLLSNEFKQVVEDQTYFYFQTGFQKCIE